MPEVIELLLSDTAVVDIDGQRMLHAPANPAAESRVEPTAPAHELRQSAAGSRSISDSL
jgi:hypothetical protein